MERKVVILLSVVCGLLAGLAIGFSFFRNNRALNPNAPKPKLVIYLGCFVADQTIGFNYVQWINENHIIKINNEYIKNYKTKKQVDDINCYIEWSDYIDILGYWNHKPTWKEILPTYRKQNINEYIKSDEIDWE
jgi:hypothetical protein